MKKYRGFSGTHVPYDFLKKLVEEGKSAEEIGKIIIKIVKTSENGKRL
tara:strand:- start:87 stop:230 length:144 start_codon:yes stop_codon:yes gene_type:complete